LFDLSLCQFKHIEPCACRQLAGPLSHWSPGSTQVEALVARSEVKLLRGAHWFNPLSMALICSAVLVSACGGGGGNETQETPGPAPMRTPLEGQVVNSAVAGATVRVYDDTGVLVGTTTSRPDGRFELALTQPGPYRVVSTGGRSNGADYLGELAAWCDEAIECGVTPLSTALVHRVDEGGFNAADGWAFLFGSLQLAEDPFLNDAADQGFDLAAARATLADGAGLEDWVTGLVDWLVNPDSSAPPGIPSEASVFDPAPAPDPAPVPDPMPVGPAGHCPGGTERSVLLQLVNDARGAARQCGNTTHPAAPPLQWSCQLEAAALGHSIDMGMHNFFSHTGSDGLSAGHRITQAGYAWRSWAENIAAGYSTAEAVVQAWLNSPGHCRNIMNPHMAHTGVAYAMPTGSEFRIYWTQKLARP